MLTEEDYTNLEQRLFALVNDMGLNFAKYSTLITISAELNDVEEDYRVRYTEAKSVPRSEPIFSTTGNVC